MRYIDPALILPPEGFEEASAQAQADDDENINNHSSVWQNCKSSLKQASFDKCFYCEMKEIRSDGAVDHYRPKSKYKWAAFLLDNFRFACTFCNSRRTDQKTGEVGGKGADFPLREGCVRATCSEEICNEVPLLLDPCKAADPDALDFRTDGVAVPAVQGEGNLRNIQARSSISAYHLNHSALQEARRTLAIEIQEKVADADIYLGPSIGGDPVAKHALASAVQDIKKRLDKDAPLSAFAKRVLQSYRDKPIVEQILAAP